MKINIVGDGMFGTFLRKEFEDIADITPNADDVIMAVPLSAYEEVAKKHATKHLIAVCSIQEDAVSTCLKYSSRVTGIHPLFGPNSPNGILDRHTISTFSGPYSTEITRIFSLISTIQKCASPKKHDEIMRKIHLPTLLFGQLASLIIENTEHIPEYYFTPSFKKLKELSYQMRDMGPGTIESILRNMVKK